MPLAPPALLRTREKLICLHNVLPSRWRPIRNPRPAVFLSPQHLPPLKPVLRTVETWPMQCEVLDDAEGFTNVRPQTSTLRRTRSHDTISARLRSNDAKVNCESWSSTLHRFRLLYPELAPRPCSQSRRCLLLQSLSEENHRSVGS